MDDAKQLVQRVSRAKANRMKARQNRRQTNLKAWRKSQGWARIQVWVPTSARDTVHLNLLKQYGTPPTQCHRCHVGFVDDPAYSRRGEYFYCPACRVKIDDQIDARERARMSQD